MAKPNIVFVFADQLRQDALGSYGNTEIKTPHFDRLAAEGLRFTNAFANCPLCAPYRAQLITGKYPHKNGVICNEYGLFPGQRTIAHCLGDAGYRTVWVGKWHMGYGPYTEDKRSGFDDLISFNCSNNFWSDTYWRNEQGPFTEDGWTPRLETQWALDYLRAHRAEHPEQPICLFLNWEPPHWNCDTTGKNYSQYPDEYDIYDPDALIIPANVPENKVEQTRRERADYYGMVSGIDACMGDVLNELDELGMREDTIVCMSSDHGDCLNAHGYVKAGEQPVNKSNCKANPYEEAIRIPWLLRYPKAIKPGKIDVMAGTVDMMPTLLTLCDVPVPPEVQGHDLFKAVSGQTGNEPDSVYLQNLGPCWPATPITVGLWRGIRTNRYTYARWKVPAERVLLYDCETDPLQMHNLAEVPEYADLLDCMETRLQRWIAETGDPFDTGERLPETGMLNVGQYFTHPRWQTDAPQEYVKALTKS